MHGSRKRETTWEDRKNDANRVIRGGSWNNTATNARVAKRNNNAPTNRNNNLGFRFVSSASSSLRNTARSARSTDREPEPRC